MLWPIGRSLGRNLIVCPDFSPKRIVFQGRFPIQNFLDDVVSEACPLYTLYQKTLLIHWFPNSIGIQMSPLNLYPPEFLSSHRGMLRCSSRQTNSPIDSMIPAMLGQIKAHGTGFGKCPMA